LSTAKYGERTKKTFEINNQRYLYQLAGELVDAGGSALGNGKDSTACPVFGAANNFVRFIGFQCSRK